MKSIYSLLFILLLSQCQSGPEGSQQTATLDITKEKEKLTRLKTELWPKAYREQDTVLLDSILGKEFQMIAADGSWSDKQGELDYISAHATEHDSFWYEIKRLEVHSNGTAVVAGTGHIVNDSLETIYQSTNVLIHREGQWKAILSHVSGIKPLANENR